jgi:hypothetical protein
VNLVQRYVPECRGSLHLKGWYPASGVTLQGGTFGRRMRPFQIANGLACGFPLPTARRVEPSTSGFGDLFPLPHEGRQEFGRPFFAFWVSLTCRVLGGELLVHLLLEEQKSERLRQVKDWEGGVVCAVAYSEGVRPVAFLKQRLKDVFELNPQSCARERSVNCRFFCRAINRFNSSTR